MRRRESFRVSRPSIAPRDFQRIIRAGQIPAEEQPHLKWALEVWKEEHRVIKLNNNIPQTPKQQNELVSEYLTSLKAFRASLSVKHLNASIEATRLRQLVARGYSVERAIRTVQREGKFRRIMKRRVGFEIRRTKPDYNAPSANTMNAVKLASDHLVTAILLYEAKHGRLGEKPPTRHTDRRVKFALAVINFIEGDELKASAIRARLAKQFDRVLQMNAPCKSAVAERRSAEIAWRASAAEMYREHRSITSEEAELFADGLAVDLTLDPRECARRDMARWAD